MKYFSDTEHKLKDFHSRRVALQELLKDLLAGGKMNTKNRTLDAESQVQLVNGNCVCKHMAFFLLFKYL